MNTINEHYFVKLSDKRDYKYMVVRSVSKNVVRIVAYVPSYEKDGGKSLAETIANGLNYKPAHLSTNYNRMLDQFYGDSRQC